MAYRFAVCTVETSGDGQRNCPKHLEFYSKNKFDKLVHLVGFFIRIFHDARLPERQKSNPSYASLHIHPTEVYDKLRSLYFLF
jgi:hypothetical protein